MPAWMHYSSGLLLLKGKFYRGILVNHILGEPGEAHLVDRNRSSVFADQLGD
jgi:hypothetical protein